MASIITPVWDKSELTHQFLFKNWVLYRDRPGIEFVIVNNGSTDNTPRILDQWREMMGNRLQVINLPENIGFGPANNLGVEKAQNTPFIFVSNDAVPKGDYIMPIVHAIKDNELYGAQLLDFDTGWNKFGDTLIPYLAGYCLACTRKTWKRLGGFDERYKPCDYEDIDLSYAASQQGIALKTLDLPLYHMFGQSAMNLEGGREQVTLKNRALFMEKWGLDG